MQLNALIAITLYHQMYLFIGQIVGNFLPPVMSLLANWFTLATHWIVMCHL